MQQILRFGLFWFWLGVPIVVQATQATEKQTYYQSGPLRGALVKDAPVAVYSSRPTDRWNAIFHVLYTRQVKVPVSNYYFQSPAPVIRANEIVNNIQWNHEHLLFWLLDTRFRQQRKDYHRIVGGDLPEFFFRDRDAEYLIKSPRYDRLMKLLAEELSESPTPDRSVIAGILFQQDLWNRFDLLFNYAKKAMEKDRLKIKHLLLLLGRLIKTVAPTTTDVSNVRDNFTAIAKAFPEVDERLFDKGTPWREILFTTGNALNPPIEPGTTDHALVQGYRRVFRVFLKGPDENTSAACLKEELVSSQAPIPRCVMWGNLAFGSQAMLIETPLVITQGGRLASIPLVLNVQTRTVTPVRAGNDGVYGFDDLPFAVFHGSRRDLIDQQLTSGGLHRMAADTPVPLTFSAFTRERTEELVPLHLACTICHGESGRRIMMASRHGVSRFDVLHPANTMMQQRLIESKQQSDAFKALKATLDDASRWLSQI